MLPIKVMAPRYNFKDISSEILIWKCPGCRREIRQMSYETIPPKCLTCKRTLPNVRSITYQDYFRAQWHRQRGPIKNPIYSIYKHSGD